MNAEMTYGDFFDELDLELDGKLSRRELHQAAVRLGWQWHEAPIYALLDFLTIRAPLEKDVFISCMAQVSGDPDGPYGQVLRQNPHKAELSCLDASCVVGEANSATGNVNDCSGAEAGNIVSLLQTVLNEQVACEYASALENMNLPHPAVSLDQTAFLIIDPQRSFTSGAWMQSIGSIGPLEVMPVRLAFENCARLLKAIYQRSEVMFTRCPFPPDSYDWDERFEGIIDAGQHYFIKPGNSVLRPSSNGFREWLEGVISRGKTTLVMGGCTLNSCVRVSAVEIMKNFRNSGLDVIVDLSLCGARATNYANSAQFGGISPVETAIREMAANSVTVTERVELL
jgi:nicotinamidase-related amidase